MRGTAHIAVRERVNAGRPRFRRPRPALTAIYTPSTLHSRRNSSPTSVDRREPDPPPSMPQLTTPAAPAVPAQPPEREQATV